MEGEKSNKGKCRSCGAWIIWDKVPSGKAHPFNDRFTYVRTEIEDPTTGEKTYEVRRGQPSHFSTCPAAADQQKKPEGQG